MSLARERGGVGSAAEAFDLIATILEASTEYSIIGTDLDGQILLWNEGARRIYGYESAEIFGQSISALHIPEDRASGLPGRTMETALADGKWEGKVERLRQDGGRFTARIVLTPRHDADGRPVGFLLISSDISGEARMTELQGTNVELVAAMLAKDRFLASMSHELRTPLNAILGFTGTMLMELPGPLNEEQQKQLQTVQSNGKRLLAIINDLLDLAQIESGKVELSIEPVSCREVLEEVHSTLHLLAAEKGLELDISIPEVGVTVQSDRRALSQILVNLAGNAIKFTTEGSVSVAFSETTQDGALLTRFSVVDTGIGIKPEDQETLFAAFEQADGPANRRYGDGTGLGLYISARLAELIQAKLSVSSSYGEGSAFMLDLEER